MSYPTIFATPGLKAFAEAVDVEAQRQHRQWGEQRHPDGTGRPGDRENADRMRAICKANGPGQDNWRDILAEEIAEAFAETDPELLVVELTQCAAVIQNWITTIKGRSAQTVAVHPVNAVKAPPATDEDAQRTARRESLLNLLGRAQRTGLTCEEGDLLRGHVETEIREADTAQEVARGNLRHVQLLVPELEQANEAARRALEQRQQMAEERFAIQEQRDTADRVRAITQRDRDQHAAVLAEVLSAFRQVSNEGVTHEGEVLGFVGPTVTPEDYAQWCSVVAPTVERPWWETVAEVRAELEQAQAAIKQVRGLVTGRAQTTAAGISDHAIGQYDMAVELLAALDGTEPTTEQPSYSELRAAYDESWQLIEMQKEFIGTLRRTIMTATSHREDEEITAERCEHCVRDHMAELYDAIVAIDKQYAEAFPATADGPARPGRLPEQTTTEA